METEQSRLTAIQHVIGEFEKKYPGKEDEIWNAVIKCLVRHSTISTDIIRHEITEDLSWVEGIKHNKLSEDGQV